MLDLLATPPNPTGASVPFWDACDRGELLFPKCGRCGHLFYYPRRHCPFCGDTALGWQRMSGRGTVFSHSHVHLAFQGGAWSSQLPYTVVLVDLAEGPRMLSRLIGNDASAVRGGDAVSVVFPQIGDRRYPFFQRAAAG